MGNAEQKEVDLLEIYLQGEVLHNVSTCVKGTEVTNITQEISFDFCVNKFVPRDLLSRPYLLPWGQQLLWIIMFGLMITISVIGNLIVIWIILAHRRMRNVTNLFLLNLAVADFLLASSNAAFNFVFMLESHWPFGDVFCTISNFVANLTVSTSVFTILAMSIDRFVAIVHPLRARMSKLRAYVIIISVWIAGTILSFPPLLYSITVTFKYVDGDSRTICYLVWPDGPAGYSIYDFIYNIVFFIVTYVIPMCCMAVTYTRVGRILWGSKVIGENTDLQNDVVRSKQRVVHMLIAVVVLFGICWLPYHIYFIYLHFFQETITHIYVQNIYLAIYWLAMSNSCYNPIVYYWLNTKFRDYFETILCFPKRLLTRFGFLHERPRAQAATFTYSSRIRSYRVNIPLPRSRNGDFSDRLACSRL